MESVISWTGTKLLHSHMHPYLFVGFMYPLFADMRCEIGI